MNSVCLWPQRASARHREREEKGKMKNDWHQLNAVKYTKFNLMDVLTKVSFKPVQMVHLCFYAKFNFTLFSFMCIRNVARPLCILHYRFHFTINNVTKKNKKKKMRMTLSAHMLCSLEHSTYCIGMLLTWFIAKMSCILFSYAVTCGIKLKVSRRIA